MPRETWGSRLGFVLAGLGMAVGYGNIVRFPSLVAQNGGAAFVLLYVAIVLLVGVPALMAEMLIGREGRGDPSTAYARLGGARWRHAGTAMVVAAFFFLAFYSVYNAYALLYLARSLSGHPIAEPLAQLTSFQAGPMTLLATFGVLAAAVGVVSFGIRRGLERASLVMMPALLLLLGGLAVYALTRDGAGAGLSFYLRPRLEDLTGGTLVAAMGQAFFSLGVGLGALIAYGSYLKPTSDIGADSGAIAAGDTTVALLAGFMVFPLLFSLGLAARVTAPDVNGFAVLFATMPAAFAGIGGPGGAVLETAFFVMLFFAAFTSTIALLELAVTALVDRFALARPKAALLAGEVVAVIAVAPALSTRALSWMDNVTATVALPVFAIVNVVFVGWRMKTAAEATDRGSPGRAGRFLRWWWRLVMPVTIGTILVAGLLQAF